MARFRAPSVDSEDDDQMSSSEQQQSEGSEYVPSHHEDEEYVSEEYEETSEEDEDTSVTPPPVDEKRVDASVIPWAREIGVEPQRMHVMQSTLFRLPEEAAAFKEVSQLPARRRLLQQPNLSRKHSRDSEGDGLRAESRPVCISCFCSFWL